MHRRRFLAWMHALGASLTTVPEHVQQTIAITGQQPDVLRKISNNDVANLRATTEMFKAWDHRVGGGLSRPAVIGQLGWAVHQLDAGVTAESDAVRREWMIASALLAAVAGWKSHDAGFEQQGRGLLALGYRLAAQANSNAIQAYMLGAMIKQAVHVGHPRVGLDLARHGLELADDGTATVKCMLHALKARAHAHLGERQSLERELGSAEIEFGRISAEDRQREPWLRFYDEAELNGDAGTAWRLLSWHFPAAPRADRQRSVAQAGIRLANAGRQYGDEFARSRALCNLMAISLHMKASDPDAALAIDAASTIAHLGTINSTRVDGYRHDVQAAARPFRARGDVKVLLEQLASAS